MKLSRGIVCCSFSYDDFWALREAIFEFLWLSGVCCLECLVRTGAVVRLPCLSIVAQVVDFVNSGYGLVSGFSGRDFGLFVNVDEIWFWL